MAVSRRFLPPIQLLTAFEAVARQGSITAAARELSLTQGAVSRQILSLEDQLGVRLFNRERKRLHLTRQGTHYLEDIRQALTLISNATAGLSANPGGGVLNLSILPTFGNHWLAPKLPDFLAHHPGVTVNLATHLEPFDLRASNADAAIFHGDGIWPGLETQKLLEEQVVPACSPGLLDTFTFDRPEDLLRAPLLSLSTRLGAWSGWLEAQGVSTPPPRGMVFDQFATLAQASKHGMGIALLPLFLIAEDLQSGTLISAFGPPVPDGSAYYLAWPESRSGYPPVSRFIQWMRQVVDPATSSEST